MMETLNSRLNNPLVIAWLALKRLDVATKRR